MKCVNCGKEISDRQKFCKYCGAPVKKPNTIDNLTVKICRNCGAPIKNGFVFCDQCGAPIDGPEIGEKPRKKGIKVGTFIGILLFFTVIAGAGLFIYKTVGNSSSTGNKGESTEVATSGTTKKQNADEATSGITKKQNSGKATTGTTNKQSAGGATTGTTKKQSAGGATTGTTKKQVEPEKPHVLPGSVPDEYYEHNGHTYAFYDASRYDFGSYQEVVEFCETQGGHLAVINDRDENTFLFDLLRDHYKKTAFFGYSDENYEGSWEWADGSDRDYENWTTYGTWDLPDNGRGYGGDEDYAEFNYARDRSDIPNDGTWNDAPFMTNTKVFICEWEFDVVKELQK